MERVGRSEDFTRVAIARVGCGSILRTEGLERVVVVGSLGLGASRVNVTQTETRKLGRSLEFFMSS